MVSTANPQLPTPKSLESATRFWELGVGNWELSGIQEGQIPNIRRTSTIWAQMIGRVIGNEQHSCRSQAMARREALHVLVHPRLEEQDLRRAAPQLPYATVRQCAAAMLRIAVMGLSRTRPRSAVLPPLGGTHRQTTSDHPIARKLAILAYRAFKGELVYRDLGADAYDRLHRTRTLRRLRQRAATLGF